MECACQLAQSRLDLFQIFVTIFNIKSKLKGSLFYEKIANPSICDLGLQIVGPLSQMRFFQLVQIEQFWNFFTISDTKHKFKRWSLSISLWEKQFPFSLNCWICLIIGKKSISGTINYFLAFAEITFSRKTFIFTCKVF